MEKWLAIAMMVIFGSLAIGGSIEKYAEKQCRIEAIKTGIEAEKINQACGVK